MVMCLSQNFNDKDFFFLSFDSLWVYSDEICDLLLSTVPCFSGVICEDEPDT